MYKTSASKPIISAFLMLLIMAIAFPLFLPLTTTLGEGEATLDEPLYIPVMGGAEDFSYYASYFGGWYNGPSIRTKKYIALTFDDGPSKHTTPILDALRMYGGKATFCVIGNRVEDYRATIRQAARQGCEVIGHTWSHPNLADMSAESVRSQISSASEAVERLTGVRCRMFRPPYGSTNQTVMDVAAELKLAALMWSVDTEDWTDNDAERIYNHIMDNASDGAIILCHDIYAETAEAACRAIPDLIKQGYQLVTVSELIRRKTNAAPTAGAMYYEGARKK